MTIDVCWLTRGQSNPHPPCETITLSGRKYQVFEDVIYRTFGMNSGTGAFLVRVQQNKDDLVCTARIYSKQGSRTFGQGFEGVPVSLAPQAYSQNDIPGIASNNSFRTNFYALAGDGGATLRMQVKNNQAGWAYTTVHLGAYEPILANISQLFTFPEPLADGILGVEVTSGSAVFGASKVDNLSEDPSTLEAILSAGSANSTPTPTPTSGAVTATPTRTPTRTRTPTPTASIPTNDVVVTMTNNATYHLDVDSVEFCFGTYCRSTLKVHREDGAGLEFQKHEIDAIDGPSTKVLWLNSCSIPDLYRDRFYLDVKAGVTSGYYVFFFCGETAVDDEDFRIDGTEVGTGAHLSLYLKDMDLADFP